MTWSWQIYIYLWLAGMGGGAFFATFLANKFSGGKYEALVRPTTYMAIVMVAIGTLLLLIDLGEPLRFWHLLLGFRIGSIFTFFPVSPMSLGTWILIAWLGLAVVMAILWWVPRWVPIRALKSVANYLGWVVMVLSVLVMTYTGVLLATSNQPLWAGTLMLPVLFVVSATSTGVAAALLVAAIRPQSATHEAIAKLSEADAIIVVLEIVALIGLAIWLGASTMGGTMEALLLLVTGPMALFFWIGVVLLALLIPLAIELATWGKRVMWGAVATASACVVVGGLVLRAVVVLSGQG